MKSKLTKVQHSIPLLSLDKTKQIDDIIKFRKDKELIAMLKLDGLTVELIYDNGELKLASTRGSGMEGEDITHNARVFKNIPLTISHKGHIKLSGEALIHFNDFAEINSKLPDGEKYKTPRNLTSGSVRQLDSKECAGRNVHFYAYNLLECIDKQNKNKLDDICYLKELGFDTVPWVHLKPVIKEIVKEHTEIAIDSLKEKAEKKNIPIDGIVFTYNDKKYGESLGKTSHHPLHSLSYKFEDETATTTLRDIEWSIGRSGCLTPVGIFDTVELDGTEVSRASLHNLSIIENLQLGIGDEIVVQKANMIIPQIIDNKTRNNTINFNINCPICFNPTEVIQENESKVLMCVNPDCRGKLLSRFSHFVSKQAMNIEGLSEATLDKFIKAGWLKTFTDIYKLDRLRSEIIALEGFGKKSYEKLWSAIDQSKNVKLENFLVAFGIEAVGRTASKSISKLFNGDVNEFIEALENNFDFTSLNDFGNITHNSIYSWFKKDDGVGYATGDFKCGYFNDMIHLIPIMNFEKVEKKEGAGDNPFFGKTIVATGTLQNFTRDNIQKKFEELGAKVVGSVSKNTDFVLAGDKAGSKLTKAQQLGVRVLSENEFLEMIGGV